MESLSTLSVIQVGKKTIIHKEINYIFVEIDKKNTATKHYIIVGCIYRPPCYPIIEFNELIGSLLDKLEKITNIFISLVISIVTSY